MNLCETYASLLTFGLLAVWFVCVVKGQLACRRYLTWTLAERRLEALQRVTNFDFFHCQQPAANPPMLQILAYDEVDPTLHAGM